MEWESNYSYNGFQPRFEEIYRCLPFSNFKNSELESGNKIIMPSSAISQIMSINMEHPWMFQIQNYSDPGLISHCGVLEFDSEEGFIHMPEWMMESLNIQEGDLVLIRNASLQKGLYMKLQPHESAFTELSNPKAVLEKTLRMFACLTSGDMILVRYNERDFFFNVLETKPGDAISLIDTDCELEFETPLNCKKIDEEPKPAAAADGRQQSEKLAGDKEDGEGNEKFRAFTGKARRLDGEPTAAAAVEKDMSTSVVAEKKSSQDGGKEEEKEMFKPFTGKSYVLGN